jgi:hypothetical protein
MTSSLEMAQERYRRAHQDAISPGQQIFAAVGLAHELMRSGQPEAGHDLMVATTADQYSGPTNERDF